MKRIRIGAGSGMLGDRLDPAVEIVERGDVQYIAFDNLGEVTIADLQRRRMANPDRGYADVRRTMQAILPTCLKQGIKIVTNAGGVNARGARDRLLQLARTWGYHGLKVAAVLGDDSVGEEGQQRIGELRSQGCPFTNLDTGADLSTVADRITGLSVYMGCWPVVAALRQGAQVCITGRYADASLWLAPLAYEFNWQERDWDHLAFGVVVGHLLECTGMVTGGSALNWEQIPGLERLGYPIAEVDGEQAIITKVEGSGGVVNLETVKSQLLYEIGDPTAYITPDVIADFTSIRLEQVGRDRVRVWGVKGKPRTDSLKAIVGYLNGWVAEGYVSFAAPRALDKARFTAEMLKKRFPIIGIDPVEVRADLIGVNSILGELTPPSPPPAEVMLRMAIRTHTEAEASRFLQEFVPLYVAGPPGACGIILREPREQIAVWPTLIPRSEGRWAVEMAQV